MMIKKSQIFHPLVMQLGLFLLSINETVIRYSFYYLVNYIIHNTYNTNDRRDTAILLRHPSQ